MRRPESLALLCLTLALPASAAERLVALTPDVAEIVLALGAAGELVGRDAMSTEPALAKVPEIGLSRALSAEPVAAVKPTLVLGSAMAQPPSIYSKLRRLGLRAELVAQRPDGRDFADGVRKVGQLLGKGQEAAGIASRWEAAMRPQPATGKRYLLSYDGRYVAGRNTAGDTLIRAAGGINAAADVDGMKPLTREGWLKLQPDVVIVADHNRALYGSPAQLAARPELRSSPAARAGRVQAWPANRFMRMGMDSPQAVMMLRALVE